MATTLDSHLDAPSVTEPGDGPADTTDPTERASSATPDKGAAAAAGYGTVNAVVKLPDRKSRAPKRDESEDRIETYEVEGPDGEYVTVTRNIETGETKVEGRDSDSDSGERREVAEPDKGAGKAAWVDYAVSKGLDPADARKKTHDQLVAEYGSK